MNKLGNEADDKWISCKGEVDKILKNHLKAFEQCLVCRSECAIYNNCPHLSKTRDSLFSEFFFSIYFLKGS